MTTKTIKHVLTSNPKNIEEWTKKYLKAEDYCIENKKECYITISFNKSQMRSNALNSLAACYYKTVSDREGDSEIDVKAFCKLHFGIQVLEGQASEYEEKPTNVNYNARVAVDLLYDINFFQMNYATKLEFMKNYNITSLMNKETFCKYLNEVERHYSEKCGIILQSINTTLRNNALNLG